MEKNNPVFHLGDVFSGIWELKRIHFLNLAFVKSAKPLNVSDLNNRQILVIFIKFLPFLYNTFFERS